MTDDREHTGRRPKYEMSDDDRSRRALDAAGREDFDQLLTGDDTVDDAHAEPVRVRREITGVTEVADRAAAEVEQIDPQFARVARAVARVVVSHFHSDRMREANEVLRAAAGEPAEIRNVVDELEKELRRRDHKIREDVTAEFSRLSEELKQHELADTKVHTDLVGAAGTNGKVGELNRRVGLIWGLLIAVALLAAGAAGGAIAAVRSSGRDDGALDEWRRQVDAERAADDVRLEAITGALWRLGAFSPAPPAQPPAGDPR